MVQANGSHSMSVVALSNLSRAATIVVRLCGSKLFQEELDDLRFVLRRFGTRWILGRKRAEASLSKY